MGQGIKSTRDTIRTDKKTNLNSGGKFSLLWMGIQPNVNCVT